MRVGGRSGLVAVVGAVALSVVAVSGGGAARAASPTNRYRADDFADGQAMYVLPPGENGLVNAADALQFETTGKRPAASDDQLSQYSNLLYGAPTLTNAKLTDYFNDESFGVKPEDVTRTETPGEGVTIYRDKHDVPHIYGDTNPSAAFGAGYAQAEDRLFMMDVLRHYGAGTLASFLGASCDFEQMDHDQLLLSPYTPAQAQAQVDALPKRYGHDGEVAKQMIDAYVQGVNAYIDATKTDPSKLPADYVAAAPDQTAPAEVDRRRRRLDRRPDRRHLRQGRWLRGEERPPADLPAEPLRHGRRAEGLPRRRPPERPAGADHDHRQDLQLRRAHQGVGPVAERAPRRGRPHRWPAGHRCGLWRRLEPRTAGDSRASR